MKETEEQYVIRMRLDTDHKNKLEIIQRINDFIAESNNAAINGERRESHIYHYVESLYPRLLEIGAERATSRDRSAAYQRAMFLYWLSKACAYSVICSLMLAIAAFSWVFLRFIVGALIERGF